MNKTEEMGPEESIMREIIAQGDKLMDEMAAFTEMLKRRNQKFAIIFAAIVIGFVLGLIYVFGWLV